MHLSCVVLKCLQSIISTSFKNPKLTQAIGYLWSTYHHYQTYSENTLLV